MAIFHNLEIKTDFLGLFIVITLNGFQDLFNRQNNIQITLRVKIEKCATPKDRIPFKSI